MKGRDNLCRQLTLIAQLHDTADRCRRCAGDGDNGLFGAVEVCEPAQIGRIAKDRKPLNCHAALIVAVVVEKADDLDAAIRPGQDLFGHHGPCSPRADEQCRNAVRRVLGDQAPLSLFTVEPGNGANAEHAQSAECKIQHNDADGKDKRSRLHNDAVLDLQPRQQQKRRQREPRNHAHNFIEIGVAPSWLQSSGKGKNREFYGHDPWQIDQQNLREWRRQ